MIIKGFQQTSLIDFPSHVAAVVFVPRCNFRCSFCYNKKLVENSEELEEISEQKIFEALEKRKKLIDGVVVTGGEPTLYADLPNFIRKIKDMGLLVKLDTNGTNPNMVKQLIEDKMIDYIAMDIKNSPEKYDATVNMPVDIEKIKKTAKLIMDSGINYEFRTTTLPRIMDKEDFIKIGKWLEGAKKYCIQQFKPFKGLINTDFASEKSFSTDEAEEIKELLKPYFKKIELRA